MSAIGSPVTAIGERFVQDGARRWRCRGYLRSAGLLVIECRLRGRRLPLFLIGWPEEWERLTDADLLGRIQSAGADEAVRRARQASFG